jgi:hypothetical protein
VSTDPIDSPAGFPVEGTGAACAWCDAPVKSAPDDTKPGVWTTDGRTFLPLCFGVHAGISDHQVRARHAEVAPAPAVDPVEQARKAYEAAEAEVRSLSMKIVEASSRSTGAYLALVDAMAARKAAEKAAGGGKR